MGKNQHSKDRLFLTATEHASGEHRGYGKQSNLNLPYRTLPFDCCAISFRPFDTPLGTADGSIFELLNIVPYLKKYRRHPVTGKPLAAGDLVKLHFHKNQEGQYACPVLYKPFTQHTHIVAIRPTGHVYCYDAVKQMNLKSNHLRDLLDETPFTRDDIIHIQDPSDGNKREMERFSHVRENLQADLKKDGGVRHNDATSRIMQQTVNEIAPVSNEEVRRQRYAFLKGRKDKGYAQLQFGNGLGNVNLELHCDVAPMACENFLLLLERGYYKRTPIHRLIKNFMVQCGDPTGTGTGGESAWGAPFKDEISNKLRHEGSGILSMANSGPDSNGSQFFLTFKSAAHLDGKHTIFGRVVGGLDVLATLGNLPTDKEDRPTQPLVLLGGAIFVNPFTDLDQKMQEAAARAAAPDGKIAEERAATKATDAEAWFNVDSAKPAAHRQGIGRYIAPQHRAADAKPEGSSSASAGASASSVAATAQRLLQQADDAAPAEPPKKKPKSGGFGNFSGW